MENQDVKNILTAKEAAKFLGIKPARLRQLRLQGRVEGTRLGYNETVYTIAQLRRADISKRKPGKKKQTPGVVHVHVSAPDLYIDGRKFTDQVVGPHLPRLSRER